MAYPKFLETVPCRITAFGGKEDAAGQAVEDLEWRGKCIFSECAEKVISEDKSIVTLAGAAIIEGEAALFLSGFSGGHLTVYPGSKREKTMLISGVKWPRNPDGTVHHTRLELM